MASRRCLIEGEREKVPSMVWLRWGDLLYEVSITPKWRPTATVWSPTAEMMNRGEAQNSLTGVDMTPQVGGSMERLDSSQRQRELSGESLALEHAIGTMGEEGELQAGTATAQRRLCHTDFGERCLGYCLVVNSRNELKGKIGVGSGLMSRPQELGRGSGPLTHRADSINGCENRMEPYGVLVAATKEVGRTQDLIDPLVNEERERCTVHSLAQIQEDGPQALCRETSHNNLNQSGYVRRAVQGEVGQGDATEQTLQSSQENMEQGDRRLNLEMKGRDVGARHKRWRNGHNNGKKSQVRRYAHRTKRSRGRRGSGSKRSDAVNPNDDSIQTGQTQARRIVTTIRSVIARPLNYEEEGDGEDEREGMKVHVEQADACSRGNPQASS